MLLKLKKLYFNEPILKKTNISKTEHNTWRNENNNDEDDSVDDFHIYDDNDKNIDINIKGENDDDIGGEDTIMVMMTIKLMRKVTPMMMVEVLRWVVVIRMLVLMMLMLVMMAINEIFVNNAARWSPVFTVCFKRILSR